MIDGQPYLAHKENGDCIYLDPETTLCRLEVRFGHAAKPLGCRLFPYQLSRVLPKVVSAGIRLDCLAAQQNKGPLMTDQREQIVKLAREMELVGESSGTALGGLHSDTAIQLTESFAGFFSDDTDPAVGSLSLLLAARHFAELGTDFLNDRATMREILPPLLEKFRHRAGAELAQTKSLGAMDRLFFRLWLGNYLRRDEELIGQTRRRLRRMFDFTAILFGGGNLRHLGSEHPNLSLRQAGMFERRFTEPSAPSVWECWRRFARGRLRTLQFFGESVQGANFFVGLKRLATLFALVNAAAKVNAVASSRANKLEAADVEYAVGVIDHAYGRSAVLRLRPHRFVEGQFFDVSRYASALSSFC